MQTTFSGRLRARLALAAVAGALVATIGATTAHAQECSIRYPFGLARLATSDRAAGHYGADLRLLYGDWGWPTLGLDVSVIKASRYVQDVAGLVRDCLGDVSAGRLDFTRHQVVDAQTGAPRPETDAEYFVRAFDALVALRREFATIELNFDALVRGHAPLVPAADLTPLRSIANATQIRMLELAANRTTGIGWVVVHAQDLQRALDQFQTAHELTRQLITIYLSQFPGLRDTIIDDLIANTNGVLDQYGAFYSPERRAALQALLDAANGQRDQAEITALVVELGRIADELQAHLQGVWEHGGPLFTLASKLKFIFGSCTGQTANHPLTSTKYFGDLPVAKRIVQEGDDAPYCIP